MCAALAAGCSDDGGSDGGSGGSAGSGGTAGSGGGGTGGTGGADVPIDDLPGLYASAQCDLVKKCYGPIWDIISLGEDCETTYGTAIGDELGRFKKSIEDGKTVYDGTKVTPCLEALKAAKCDELETSPAACDEVLVGQVELGGACQTNEECATTAFCKLDAACPGTCTAKQDVGVACQDDDDCREGLKCDETCVQPAAKDGACGGGVAPDCGGALFCLGENEDEGTAGKCVGLDEAFVGKLGEPCLQDAPLCEAGLSCAISVDGQGQPSWACVARSAAGAACNLAFPDACPVDEYCDPVPQTVAGTCKKRPTDGQACAEPAFGDPVCAANTRCDAGVCTARRRLGGNCVDDAVCFTDFCSDGKCASKGSCE